MSKAHSNKALSSKLLPFVLEQDREETNCCLYWYHSLLYQSGLNVGQVPDRAPKLLDTFKMECFVWLCLCICPWDLPRCQSWRHLMQSFFSFWNHELVWDHWLAGLKQFMLGSNKASSLANSTVLTLWALELANQPCWRSPVHWKRRNFCHGRFHQGAGIQSVAVVLVKPIAKCCKICLKAGNLQMSCTRGYWLALKVLNLFSFADTLLKFL